MGALVFGGVRTAIRWYVAYVMVFLASGTIGALVGSVSSLPAWFTSTMLALNVAVGGTMVFTLLALFANQRQDALAALRTAQEQAEDLLLNILPSSIAEKLKAHPETIADQFSAASICRMESHGTPGRIQITRATYELLRDDFECEPRGTVAVKGKGDMETWYLVGPRPKGGRPAGRQMVAPVPSATKDARLDREA
jgi:hypothetical protein